MFQNLNRVRISSHICTTRKFRRFCFLLLNISRKINKELNVKTNVSVQLLSTQQYLHNQHLFPPFTFTRQPNSATLYLEGISGFTLVEHLVRNYLKRISININGYVLRICTILAQEEHSHRDQTKLGNCLRENLVSPCRRHSLFCVIY